jgi:hypothetical protein
MAIKFQDDELYPLTTHILSYSLLKHVRYFVRREENWIEIHDAEKSFEIGLLNNKVLPKLLDDCSIL